MRLTVAEVRLLAAILSPGYVCAAAREHGIGDRILGAEAAYREARGAVRSYLRHVIARERRRIELCHPVGPERADALADAKREVRRTMEALGYRFTFQRLTGQIATPWRRLAFACFPAAGAAIDGFCELDLGTYRPDTSRLARTVIRALSRLLRERPALNRAVLDGRVWQRSSAEIMVHAEVGPDQIEPLVVDASSLSDAQTASALLGQLRQVLRAIRHPLYPVGAELTRAWVDAGFIASPAGAMVSDATRSGITHPLPALIPANGVPLAVAIGAPRGPQVALGIRADHRAGDSSLYGEVHEWMRSEVPRLYAESSSSAEAPASARRLRELAASEGTTS